MQIASHVHSSVPAVPVLKSPEQLAADYNNMLSALGRNTLIDCCIEVGRKKSDESSAISKFIETQVNDQFLCVAQSKSGILRPRLLRTSGKLAGQYVEPRLWYTRLPRGNYSFQALYYTTPISTKAVCVDDLNGIELLLRRFADVAVSSDIVMREILHARPNKLPRDQQPKPRYTMRQLLSLSFD